MKTITIKVSVIKNLSIHLAYPCERSQAIFRSPFTHSLASSLLVRPEIVRCSLSG